MKAWAPVVDGETLPLSAERAIELGRAHDVPLLIGTDVNEADVFFAFDEGPFGAGDLHDLTRLIGAEADQLVERYQILGHYRDRRDSALAVATDWMFRMPSIAVAQSMAAVGQAPVYMYLFEWSPPTRPNVRAFHTSDGAFIFGTLDSTEVTRGVPGAQALSQKMLRSWAAFARTGDPNHPLIPEWPRYFATNRATMLFGNEVHVEVDPQAATRLAWPDA
jgi:para-nitrobenzyl esterase